MKEIKSNQKAMVSYGHIPKALVKDMKGECAIVIEIRPDSDGEVILQECIAECVSDNASGNHYTISHDKVEQKIIEKTDYYACAVVTYNIKDIY